MQCLYDTCTISHNSAITDEAEIRQLILELKNKQKSQPVVHVSVADPEEGAVSDRASTPDQGFLDGTPEMGRKRSRRCGLYICVCVCVCVCARACVCACVCVCVLEDACLVVYM